MALANCVYTYPHPAHRDSIIDCPGVPFPAVAPSADEVQQMLDDATRAFADAGTSSERVEVIRDLLAGWYAAWPATAVTDEHEGIAHQLVALVDAAEARTEACPCLPGAPKHRHGVGGYRTAASALTEDETAALHAAARSWVNAGNDRGSTDLARALAKLRQPQEPPCVGCGQREADHVDGRCSRYRPAEGCERCAAHLICPTHDDPRRSEG